MNTGLQNHTTRRSEAASFREKRFRVAFRNIAEMILYALYMQFLNLLYRQLDICR